MNRALCCNLRTERTAALRQPNTSLHRGAALLAGARRGQAFFSLKKDLASLPFFLTFPSLLCTPVRLISQQAKLDQLTPHLCLGTCNLRRWQGWGTWPLRRHSSLSTLHRVRGFSLGAQWTGLGLGQCVLGCCISPLWTSVSSSVKRQSLHLSFSSLSGVNKLIYKILSTESSTCKALEKKVLNAATYKTGVQKHGFYFSCLKCTLVCLALPLICQDSTQTFWL